MPLTIIQQAHNNDAPLFVKVVDATIIAAGPTVYWWYPLLKEWSEPVALVLPFATLAWIGVQMFCRIVDLLIKLRRDGMEEEE